MYWQPHARGGVAGAHYACADARARNCTAVPAPANARARLSWRAPARGRGGAGIARAQTHVGLLARAQTQADVHAQFCAGIALDAWAAAAAWAGEFARAWACGALRGRSGWGVGVGVRTRTLTLDPRAGVRRRAARIMRAPSARPTAGSRMMRLHAQFARAHVLSRAGAGVFRAAFRFRRSSLGSRAGLVID